MPIVASIVYGWDRAILRIYRGICHLEITYYVESTSYLQPLASKTSFTGFFPKIFASTNLRLEFGNSEDALNYKLLTYVISGHK